MSPVLIALAIPALIGLGYATWRAPRLMSALVWAVFPTIGLSIAITMLLPGAILDRLLFMVIALPLVWAAIQFWCYWHKSKWQVLGGMFGATALSATVILAIG